MKEVCWISAFCVLFLRSGFAIAGDGPLDVIYVNMTPDGVRSAESQQCSEQIEAVLKAGSTKTQRIAETKLRTAMGNPSPSPFMDWQSDVFKKAKETLEAFPFAVILVDCQPAKDSLEIAISTAGGDVWHLRWRKVNITERLTTTIAQVVLRRAWSGWIP